MNNNTINNDTINNSETNLNNYTIMDLENLTQEYSNLLLQYQQAVTNYNSYLQQEQSNQPEKLVYIKGQSYYDSSNTSISNVSNVNICLAKCSSTSGCTGATYNANTKSCTLGSSTGKLGNSLESDYAIVPQGTQLINNIEIINNQLLSVNKQILNIIKQGEKLYNTQESTISDQYTILIDNYQSLLDEKEKITSIINEYVNLDEQENLGSMATNQNYYSFLLLFGIVIIVIVIIIKLTSTNTANTANTINIQTGGDLNKNAYFLVFGMFFVAIIIYFIFIKNKRN